MPVKTSEEHDEFRKQINSLRHSSYTRFKNNFEAIIEKYSKVPEEGRDVVDIRTLEIVEDHGHIRNMKRKPYGHFSSKFRRPKKDKKKLKKLIKLVKKNLGQNNVSFFEGVDTDLSEETCKEVIDLNFFSKNLKVPILKRFSWENNSEYQSSMSKRDSLSMESAVLNNHGLEKKELQDINKLFDYKVKNFETSKFNLSCNNPPVPCKEKSKRTVSVKKCGIQVECKKKRADDFDDEDCTTLNERFTPRNTSLKINRTRLQYDASKTRLGTYASPVKKKKYDNTPDKEKLQKDFLTSDETLVPSTTSKKLSTTQSFLATSKTSLGSNASFSKKKESKNTLIREKRNENSTPRSAAPDRILRNHNSSKICASANTSIKKKFGQPSFDTLKSSLDANCKSPSKKKMSENTPVREKQYENLTPRYAASDRILRNHNGGYSSKICFKVNTSICKKKKSSNIPSDEKTRRDSFILNKLHIISDLFTYKTKDFDLSEISCIVSPYTNKQVSTIHSKEKHYEKGKTVDNCFTPRPTVSDQVKGFITPTNTGWKKICEDGLTSNGCVSLKNSPSYKYRKIDELFNYSTPTRRLKLSYFSLTESPITPRNAKIQVDDLLCTGTPSIKKSNLELLKNSSKSKTSTSKKHKTSDVYRKKSRDSISVNERCMTSSKNSEFTVTPFNNQISANNLPKVLLRRLEDDLPSYNTIQKRLF